MDVSAARMIGRCYVSGLQLKQSCCVLSAANKMDLAINSDVNLHLVIDGHEVTVNVSVSPAINELLLGVIG